MEGSSYLLIISAIIGIGLLSYLAYTLITNRLKLDRIIKNEWLTINIKVGIIAFTCAIMLIAFIFYPTGNLSFYMGYITISFSMIVSLFVANVFQFILPWLKKKYTKLGTTFSGAIIMFISVILSSELAMLFIYFTIQINMFVLPDHFYYLGFNSIIGGTMGMGIFIFELKKVTQNLALKEQELKIINLERSKTKAELEHLQSKVNPHFLYNSLNTIASLIHDSPDTAERMTIQLSKFFRFSLNYENKHYTTIKEEIEIVTTYLSIEKIRFEDKLSVLFDVATETESLFIPKFLLQPLVENSIKHGFSDPTSTYEIKLGTKLENGKLIIWVGDSGESFPDNIEMGYGIQSTYEKLELMFPDQHSLFFNNDPKKIVIEITNPIKNESEIFNRHS